MAIRCWSAATTALRLRSGCNHLRARQRNSNWATLALVLFWVDAFVGRNGEIAFTGSTPTQPSELYYMASANDTPRRLTDFNHEIASLALGKARNSSGKGRTVFRKTACSTIRPIFRKTASIRWC